MPDLVFDLPVTSEYFSNIGSFEFVNFLHLAVLHGSAKSKTECILRKSCFEEITSDCISSL